MSGGLRFIGRRAAFALVLVVGVSAIVFFLVNAIGNPIAMLISGQPNATEDQIAALTAYYHLDQPAWQRYLAWLVRLAHFDLGSSITYNQPVWQMLYVWGWETLKIQIPAIIISILISIPLAMTAARRQNSRSDMSIMAGSLLGHAMPTFLMGIVLILVFAYWLGWVPSYGAYSLRAPAWHSVFLDGLWHMVLPVGMLTVFNTATFTLLLRASLIDVLRQDFVVAARASGLPERRILYGHALRNAFIPVLTYLGIAFGLMLATAPVTETVFTWPGLGFLYINAIQQLDYPVIMGETVVIAVMLVGATLLTDIAYVAIDPRIRIG
ncbi:ABC transporter permease [Acidisphaera sp. L21]|uniref:ABC transporter permease n=1 Tax=Acidisphaera sp. L21 TaxID=1641851 RepID=UPI00131BDF87|nr:ABC transporter permease [Acidisphaera sp. L21]